MRTPERLSALRSARQTLRNRDRKIARIKKQLESLTSRRGVAVESHVNEEIKQVIERERSEMESLPESDFRRIFWEQQVCFCVKYMYVYIQYMYLFLLPLILCRWLH